MKRFHLIFVFSVACLLAACGSVTVKPNASYTGAVRSTEILKGGALTFNTEIKDGAGKMAHPTIVERINTVLGDAATKHGIPLGNIAGNTPYRLETSLLTPAGKSLWKAEAQTARNLGMAVIPVAGFFTPRYYTLSSSFVATFRLYKADQLVLTENVTVDDTEEISVSNTSRQEEILEKGTRFWEARRDQAIEKFFSAVAQNSTKIATN